MLQQILLAYIFLSCLLFCFPKLLHRQNKWWLTGFVKKCWPKLFRVAHRGGPRYVTENTVEAFKHSEPYCEMMEMDVCITRDKVLVVHHDPNLFRTCGIPKLINQLDYAELPPFQSTVKLDFLPYQTIKTNPLQKIPTLAQVLSTFPETLINIELKTPTLESIDSFAKLIKAHNAQNRTVIGCRSPLHYTMMEMHPELSYFFNDKGVLKVYASYFLGLLPFIRFQQKSLQLPVWTQDFQEWKISANSSWKTRLFFLGLQFMNLVSRPLFWHLEKRGIVVMGWVCNQVEDYRRAKKIGFKAIMTDDPLLLSEWLGIMPAKSKVQINASESKPQQQ